MHVRRATSTLLPGLNVRQRSRNQFFNLIQLKSNIMDLFQDNEHVEGPTNEGEHDGDHEDDVERMLELRHVSRDRLWGRFR